MTRRLHVAVSLAAVVAAPALRAQGPPPPAPESLGLSGERLQRPSAAVQRAVDEGRVAGVVTYVARAGVVAHLAAFGMADVEAGR